MRTINIHEAKTNLSRLVENVAAGEEIVIAKAGKPMARPAVILAGHNGSGKTTMWREHLADKFQIPLVNADRMMMSILPEIDGHGHIPAWATSLHDNWVFRSIVTDNSGPS